MINLRHGYQVSEMESKADKITKEVERTLYEETLIPDARSDVLRY